jgi:hypothetical protein
MRAHKTLLAILAALLAAVTLYACGGSGSGGGGGSSAGSAMVSAYVTDDLGGYESVVLTLKSVQLRHTSGRSCEIIPEQPPTDVAELGRDQLVSLVDTTNCEAGPYNRLFVELDDDVTLRETATSPTLACKFVSYFEDGFPLPNRLACNGDTCSLNITGAVNLVARNHEHVALDVDLKQFIVDTSVDPCTVTLKVSPLHAADKLAAGYRIALSGTVSDVVPAEDRFTLTVRGKPFTVRHDGVTDQPGLDALLERAAMDELRTTVRCQTLDAAATPPLCTAQTVALQPLKAISVKAKGTVTVLAPVAQTFTLIYGAGTMLPVNYAKAAELGKVVGPLADNAVASVKLYGSDPGFFFAREVEVE